ncbi:MAG: non-homologous end-joining DNA ligase [Armatimonadia bacterium]
MLAVLSTMPPDQANWGFEYKWDGVRCLAYWKPGTLTLESRNLLDTTSQYPELQALRDNLPDVPAVLDGEIIAINEKGRVSFLNLSHRMHVVSSQRVEQRAALYPVTFMIFDILYLDGYSTMELPYTERRAILEGLKLDGPNWRTPPYYAGLGDQMSQAAHTARLEGIVAKRLDSVYEPGKRTGAWRKLKFVGRQEFIIGGWLPYKANDLNMVGSLLLGYNDEVAKPGKPLPPLHYAGSVGTGFAEKTRRELAALMKARPSDRSPFSGNTGKHGAIFVRPDLIAEVEYRGWSPAGSLRQPSFKGLREDKDPREIVRESRWKS